MSAALVGQADTIVFVAEGARLGLRAGRRAIAKVNGAYYLA